MYAWSLRPVCTRRRHRGGFHDGVWRAAWTHALTAGPITRSIMWPINQSINWFHTFWASTDLTEAPAYIKRRTYGRLWVPHSLNLAREQQTVNRAALNLCRTLSSPRLSYIVVKLARSVDLRVDLRTDEILSNLAPDIASVRKD